MNCNNCSSKISYLYLLGSYLKSFSYEDVKCPGCGDTYSVTFFSRAVFSLFIMLPSYFFSKLSFSFKQIFIINVVYLISIILSMPFILRLKKASTEI
ncbi:TIGR04104 family putative zinc finger protein [Clostridium polynesiense]|uniref:TIGR04104 family putative zinc finger protein n=1 Tax=Clostridium polynesiense TaxID=1325933 RepID=UPI00058CFAE4